MSTSSGSESAAPHAAPAPFEAYAPQLALDWLTREPLRRHRRVQGGVVFLDITGFTALSEALAALGRVGAEEITELIDRTTDALLAEAHRHGGTMLAFGGDALLLLFEGEGGGVRALEAGRSLLGILRAANPVATRAGAIDLGMTVGVHEGAIDLVLAGGATRQLIVAGPGTSAVLRAEAAAGQGALRLSDHLASQLPSELLDLPGPGPSAEQPPPVDRAAHPPPPAAADAARLLMDPQLAEHLSAEEVPGEHRTASVAFIRATGTDALFTGDDPAVAVDAVDELVGAVQRACADTGTCLLGSDVDVDGVKLILVAGVPRVRGDDADRLLRAVRKVVEAGTRLRPSIGVARGHLFAGPLGPPRRRTFTVLGDTVNLAARVMAEARPDEVLATPTALNAARTLFDVRGKRTFVAKGKRDPVPVIAVGREAGIRLRLRPDDHGFVGRSGELASLVSAVDGLRSGRGAVVALTGPAGIGKSRLVDELQHHLPRTPFALAACQEAARDRPHYATAQWLRTIVGGDRRAADEAVLAAARALLHEDDRGGLDDLPLLGAVLGVDLPDGDATADLAAGPRLDRTVALLRRLLRAARPGSQVLVVEDGQWADPESARTIAALCQQLDDVPWLVIGTARGSDDLLPLTGGAGAVVDVALSPLPDADARMLLMEDVAQRGLGMDRVADLIARSGGNPLFLRELATAVAAGAEGSDEIEQILQQRLDLLPARDRRVLGQAAVLGVEFPPRLLAAVAGEDAVAEDQLDRLRDFLRPTRSGPLRFNQTLYQEVAYASLPYARREALHARAARAIEDGATEGRAITGGAIEGSAIEGSATEGRGEAAVDRSVLGWHWFMAGAMDRALDHTLAAAALARERHALGTAATLYRRAREAARRSGRADLLAGISYDLGRVLVVSGAVQDARAAFESVRTLGTSSERDRALIRLARIASELGDYQGALAQLGETSAAADPHAVAVERAVVLNRLERYEEAIAVAEPASGSSDPQVAGMAKVIMAWGLGELGRPGGMAMARQAAVLLESAGDLQRAGLARNALGAALYWRGRWDDAVEAYTASRGNLERVGDAVNVAVQDLNIVEIRSDQGRLAEAAERLPAAIATLRAGRNAGGLGFADMLAGRLAARRGQPDVAQRHIDDAIRAWEDLGVPGQARMTRSYRAEALLFAGDHDGALAACASEDGSGADPTSMVLHRIAGVAAWRLGDRATARDRLHAALAMGTATSPFEWLLAQHALRALLPADPAVGDDPAAAAMGVRDPVGLALGPAVGGLAPLGDAG